MTATVVVSYAHLHHSSFTASMVVVQFSTILKAVSALPVVTAIIDASAFAPNDIIEQDVVIIGGGASGAHAAVKLRQDFGKSVVVIEKATTLVGVFQNRPW